ncbi:TPA: hypothetical protein ACH3X1_011479 [Trebouxia sp. C0004]
MTESSAAAGTTMVIRSISPNSPVASVPAGKGPVPNSPAARACVGTGLVVSAFPENAPAVQGCTASSLAGYDPAFSSPAEEEYSSDEDYDSFSDNDLSSWGSMDEVWDADSDYYDTEEEEESLAELYSHPDYQYLVRHNGQPNLSLFGGPSADITPANLLNKLMTQWSEEEDQQSPETASSSATAESCFATTSDTLLSTTTTITTSSSAGVRSATAAAAGRRGKTSLRPSADAVSMANTGCRTVPGIRPAEFREALYSTWMTGRPWGMKHMPADSDNEGNRSCQDEDMQTLQSEDDRESLDDEEERASKRNKLTEQVEAVQSQVKQMQDRMGLTSTSLAAAAPFSVSSVPALPSLSAATSSTLSASASATLPASASPKLSGAASVSTKAAGALMSYVLPWWAQEMGMIQEEYWGGLQDTGASQADLTGNRVTPVQVTQEDLSFLFGSNDSNDRSAHQL